MATRAALRSSFGGLGKRRGRGGMEQRAECLWAGGAVGTCTRIVGRMRESASLPNPNTRSCATVINALAKARVWQRACGLLEDMYVGEGSEERTPPDTICVNAAITACARVGQWQRALNLLHNHRAREIVDVISYNAALNACERVAEWQQALSLLATMGATKVKGSSDKKTITPNVISFNAAISACEKGHQWQHALRLLQLMEQRNTYALAPDVITYSACISACEKAMQWQQAVKLYDTMLKEKNVKPDAIAMNALISACGGGGQWQQALRIFHAMEDFRLEPTQVTYLSILVSCARSFS
eukprot:GEMP01033643.1.p1 GENE.GEMP01033643.1~~GEMP01033643.1.p1  ORF type:complete len:300 (+),score=84.32 GEMP01033643.1:371-1270(+)